MTGERVRTVLVVTLVALLVWLFAESRTLRAETLTVPVEVSAGGSATAYRLTDAQSWTGSLEIEVAGPTGLIDGLRARALDGVVLEIGDELPNEPGSRAVELVDAIRRADLFADSGLTVRRVSPRTLGLQTDRLETLTVPVEADLEGLRTAGPVRIDPPEVTVRLPASLAESIQLQAIAKIPPAKLAALTPGRREEISQVPLELAGLPEDAWGLRLADPRVVVTLALRVRTESLTLREVPVRLSVLPSDLAGWTLEVPPEDRVLEDVVLTGPVSAIEQIRRGEIAPGALAELDLAAAGIGTDDDVAEGELASSLRLIGLPAGVVADLGDRSVRVLLRRRAAAAEQPGG